MYNPHNYSLPTLSGNEQLIQASNSVNLWIHVGFYVTLIQFVTKT